MAYKCERCGKKVPDAYNISVWFNGRDRTQVICEECIRKIGHDELIEKIEKAAQWGNLGGSE